MTWNLGGWLGSQVGGTCWMVIAGLLAMRLDTAAGVGVLALFAMANAFGLLLWRNRHRLSAYHGVQMLLPVVGLAGAGATYMLDRSEIWEAIQVGGTVSATQMYLVLGGVVAALMASFYWRFGRQ